MKAEKEFKLRIRKKKMMDKIERVNPSVETKMNHSKKTKRFTFFGRIFLIVIFALVLLFLIFNINYLTPSKMKEHMSAVFSDFGSGNGFPYHFSSDKVLDFFDFSSSDKVILTDNDLIILNSSADPVLSYKHSMANPIARYSRDRILLFDQGSTKAVILNQSGQVLAFPNDDKIIYADICDSGESVIATKSAGNQEEVNVYGFSGKKLMSWEKGEGYIVQSTLSANGNILALAILDTENAVETVNVFTFSVSNAKQRGNTKFQSSSLCGLHFINTNDLAVLCNNKVSILNSKCEVKKEMDLPSVENKQLFCDRNGHIINTYSLYNNGKYVVDVYNVGLKKLYSKECEGEVISVNSDGSSLVTLYNNKTVEVNMIGGKVTYMAKTTTDSAFVFSESKTVYTCANGTVEKIKAKKQ